MNAPFAHDLRKPAFIETAKAFLRLSQTQRRLSHEARREAEGYEATGNYPRYAAAMLEARRLWREALWHLDRARMNRDSAYH